MDADMSTSCAATGGGGDDLMLSLSEGETDGWAIPGRKSEPENRCLVPAAVLASWMSSCSSPQRPHVQLPSCCHGAPLTIASLTKIQTQGSHGCL